MARQRKPAGADGPDAPPPEGASSPVGRPMSPPIEAGGCSWDDNNPDAGKLDCLLRGEQGVPSKEIALWRGIVHHWGVGWYLVGRPEEGLVVQVITLLLIPQDGPCCRLPGWNAVNQWAALLGSLPPEKRTRGIPVRIAVAPEGSPARSPWYAVLDTEG